MANISKLISGFKVFKATTFPKQKDIIHHLLEQQQKPKTMVISCVDLRIAPADIFATNPGELYVLSNMGGLVPKYGIGGVHGVVSAIEYAVTELEVENIIILGHAKCDALKTMMVEKLTNTKSLSESMQKWLSVASEAAEAVKKSMSDKSPEEQQAACEHESLVISLRNLLTYPYVTERLNKNKLNIFAWQFNVAEGEIFAFSPDNGMFQPIS
jgi:carbonic anhydrase